MKDPVQEVEAIIDASPANERSSDVTFLKKYIGTNLDIIGLAVPYQRNLFKKGYSFSGLHHNEQIKIWDTVWKKGKRHEVMTQAIFFWERHLDKIDTKRAWATLKTWTPRLDNWAHSDGISGLYSKLLELDTVLVFPQLKKWNTSKNPWERRQSVVSLLFYHRLRSKVLPYKEMIPLVENLLDDEHYFVQKGVGWALRELSNAYHKETLAFLKKNHARISGVAFSAAAEKLSIKEKEELKAMRKAARKKGK